MSFWVVNNTRFDKGKFAYGEDRGEIKTGPPIYCEECNSPLTMLEWLPPLEIKISKKQLGDVVFGTYTHFIVSRRFKDTFEVNNLRGIHSFTKVNIYDKGELTSLEYYYPKILLSSAQFDIPASGIVFEGGDECRN